jgi:hypothetical protein
VINYIRTAIAAVVAWVKKEEQSVETILKGWYSAVSQLEAHAEAKFSEVIFHNDIAIKANELAAAAEAEAVKAREAAAKIAAVLR